MDSRDEPIGLTDEQATQLRERGLCNCPQKKMTKSYYQIFFENIFSVFNLINAVIAAALFYVGSYKNSLFILAVVSNTLVGMIQQIRSKRAADKLSIVNEQTVHIIRNGVCRSAAITDLVLGDVISLRAGDQIPNDCEVIGGCCEVSEALITGESDPIAKCVGDHLLSGSCIVSGSCLCKVTAVGRENYADTILREIRRTRTNRSEIVRVLNRIITVITFCIVPLGALLFYNQYTLSHTSLKEAVESTAAVLIGMIPEGLVLLTSTVFALGVVRLAKRNVLSQSLDSLEALARTDILCLDKTGTITTGDMIVERTIPSKQSSRKELDQAAAAFASLTADENATVMALRSHYSKFEAACGHAISPFSSERKWASVRSDKIGTIIAGAYSSVFPCKGDPTELSAEDLSFRALCIAVSDDTGENGILPKDMRLLGFVLLRETLREGASDTIAYFREQGVDIKVISGDHPDTVRRLCSSALGADIPCADLSSMSDSDIDEAAEKYSVFGRATPQNKRELIRSMQKRGHTVGMVGDGVNDVLALKESDCSIAPANGSEAARGTASLVLLDSDFSHLKDVVGEGRRSINNLSSSAALFLTKTIFSAAMAFYFIFSENGYPFDPIQMTLISTLTIGLPSFVLSFIKNNRPVKRGFMSGVIRNALPAAMTDISAVLLVVHLSTHGIFTVSESAALCVEALAVTGIGLIAWIYRPMSKLRAAVLMISIAGFTAAFLLFPAFFGLAPMTPRLLRLMLMMTIFDLSVLLILLTCFRLLPPRRGLPKRENFNER